MLKFKKWLVLEKEKIDLANTRLPLKLTPKDLYVGLHADWYHGFKGKKEPPIKEVGLLVGTKKQFKTSPENRKDSIYLATTANRAATYASLYSAPMIIKISSKDLDKSKFYYDPNDFASDATNNPQQVAYRGSIPATFIKIHSEKSEE